MNATDDLLLLTKEFADKLNTGIHMHVAEIPYENEYVSSTRAVNQGTVTYLKNIGLLGENLLAAHSVWINNAEVTCFAEAGGQHVAGMARAVECLGIRGCLAQSVMDAGEGLPVSWTRQTAKSCIQIQEELYKNLHNTADGRIKVWFGVRQIMNATDDLLLLTKEFADKLNTGIHMHVAEIPYENEYVSSTRAVNQGTVTYLKNIGLLGENLLAAHSVWINNAEVTCFAEAGGQHVAGMARAVECLGIRGCLAQSVMDAGEGLPVSWTRQTAKSCVQIQEELYKNLHNTADGRIKVGLE